MIMASGFGGWEFEVFMWLMLNLYFILAGVILAAAMAAIYFAAFRKSKGKPGA